MSDDGVDIVDIAQPFDSLVDEAESYLAKAPGVYKKSGELVVMVQDGAGAYLRPLKVPFARYLLAQCAAWVNDDKPVHPPSAVARCILDKTAWDEVRSIRAVSAFPPISPEGGVRCEAGYDQRTQVYYTGGVDIKVPERPTVAHARVAVNTLYDIVCDFPFSSPAHKSAWLAALLTPLARFAHDGNQPLVVVQANAARVGKTTLVRIISTILLGYNCPDTTHTKNEEAERKRILPFLRAGRQMVLIDNVVGEFGGANINAIITGRSFEDRVLGQSKIIQVANDTTWCITANNVILAADTAQRCLNIRLHTTEEKPHLRTGFRYGEGDSLLGVVKERRAELLSAAITILKGYILAGMPDQKLPPWGSFESWSKLVRGAIVWAGLPDPALTREELETDSDIDRSLYTRLVEGWLELQKFVGANALTTRQVFELMNKAQLASVVLHDALEEVGGGKIPSAHTIGRHLREVRDRNLSGLAMRCIPDDKRGHQWYVEEIK